MLITGTIIHHKQRFEVLLERVEVIEFDHKLLDFEVQIQKAHSIVGYITFFIPIDNQIICGSKALKKEGNEYRSFLPFNMPSLPACSDFFWKSCKNLLI
jgi:hypothetical protein